MWQEAFWREVGHLFVESVICQNTWLILTWCIPLTYSQRQVQLASVTPVRNAAAILLFSPPYLAHSTGELPRRDTTQLCHSRDTGGTIRRAGRASRPHSAANQP